MRTLILMGIWVVVLLISHEVDKIGTLLKENYNNNQPPLKEVVLLDRKKRDFDYYKEICKIKHGAEYISVYLDCAASMVANTEYKQLERFGRL